MAIDGNAANPKTQNAEWMFLLSDIPGDLRIHHCAAAKFIFKGHQADRMDMKSPHGLWSLSRTGISHPANQSLDPVGILVTQNSPADIDNDGRPDQSGDIVGLLDFYDALIR